MNYTQEKNLLIETQKPRYCIYQRLNQLPEKIEKLKETINRTKGNQKNDASPNSISKEVESMKTNQIEILELRSTIISEKFTRGIQEEI